MKKTFFPEVNFGGFSSVDGTVQFFNRVNALIARDAVVLDVGAGRGAAAFVDESPYRQQLQVFKGRCQKMMGIDVDPVVLENPNLDEAFVIGADGIFPIGDSSVDVIISDWALGHVDGPLVFAGEILRVLKRGGGVLCKNAKSLGLYRHRYEPNP